MSKTKAKRSIRRALQRRARTVTQAGDPVWWSEGVGHKIKTLMDSGKEMEVLTIVNQTREHMKILKDLPAGVERARFLYEIYDRVLEKSWDEVRGTPEFQPPTCRKGCSFCCKINVDITDDEATLLADLVTKKGIEVDREELRYQSGMSSDDHAREGRACVFLSKEGTCRIYEHRPLACRGYFVVSDPALCDVSKHRKGDVLAANFMSPDLIRCAAMNIGSNLSGKASLPYKLRQKLEERHAAKPILSEQEDGSRPGSVELRSGGENNRNTVLGREQP